MDLRLPTKGKPGPAGASLLDRILAPDNLAAAWEAVAENAGIPGVDRERISRFRRNWEARLLVLAEDVRGNRYRPSRLRIEHIPKRNGGQRRIGVPTVTDRVLQRAALQTLLPRLDRKNEKLFSIEGSPPDMRTLPKGCPFAPRCASATDRCTRGAPTLRELVPGRATACFRVQDGEL